MQTFFVSIAIIILLLSALLLYRRHYVGRKIRKNADKKLKIFSPLINKLATKENISESDVIFLAQDPSTRQALFGILNRFNRPDLFPLHYFTAEKGAESFLVNWLEFPTELNAAPEKIELFEKITLEEKRESLDYYVFKYKKNHPLSGIEPEAWMLGVAGPYGSSSQPYDIPIRVFSRFNELGTVAAGEEAMWVHENINKK